MKKRILSIMLAVMLAVTMLPVVSYAGSRTYQGVTVDYGNASVVNSNDGLTLIYKSSGTLILNKDAIADVVAVGGGGSGGTGKQASTGTGNAFKGSGGSGGELASATIQLSSGTYTITVGAGGASVKPSDASAKQPGKNGGDSSIIGPDFRFVAEGGAGGGTADAPEAGSSVSASSSITGSSVKYGASGAASTNVTIRGTAGTANTGGGGQGGGRTTSASSGAGGSGIVVIRITSHIHEFTYSVDTSNSAILTANCTGSYCKLSDPLKLTLQDGGQFDASQLSAWREAGAEEPVLTYYSESAPTQPLSGAPDEPGSYIVTATVGSGSNTATARKSFTIGSGHIHKVGNMVIEFSEWTGTTSLPSKAGNYYLTADVTLSSSWSVPSGTVNLCLNGHVIDLSGGTNCQIKVASGCNLTILDCSSTVHYFTKDDSTGLWTLASDQSTPTEYSVTGGCITGANINNVINSYYVLGGAILVNGGSCVLYSGNIVGNTASNPGTGSYNVIGGGLTVSGGSFTMYDGEVCGNTTRNTANGSSFGGGIAVYEDSDTAKYGLAYLYGGSIHDNIAGSAGGGVIAYSGPVTVGGTVVIRNNNTQNTTYAEAGDKENNIMTVAVLTPPVLYLHFGTGEDAPADGMNVGFRRNDIATPLAVSVPDYARYITSDNAGLYVLYDSTNRNIILGSRTGMYDVTVDTVDNGTVYTNKQAAEEDETVTLTVAPADGYILDTLTVTNDSTSETVGTTLQADGTYTFTMPEADVTVTAAFAAKPTHVHDFSYAASENTITATCADTDGNCDLTDKKITLTLSTTSGTYDGTTSFPATTDNASVGMTSTTGTTLSDIGYQKRNASGGWDDITAAPVNAGEYRAFVTLTYGTGADDKVTAYQEFTVAKATQIITADAVQTFTYGDTGKSVTASALDNASLSYAAKNGASVSVSTDGTLTILKTGETTVTVTAAETDNYGSATKDITVAIDPKAIDKPTADTNSFTYTGSEQTYTPVDFDDTLMKIEGNRQTEVNLTGYTVTVTLADTDNYVWSTTGDCTFTWVIAKAEYTGSKTAEDEILSVAGSTAEVTLPDLPEGAAYGTPETTFTYVTTPSVDSGKLKLTVGTANIPDGTDAFTVTIPVTGAKNYLDYTVTATVTPVFHTHSFTYSASENTITAICADPDGQCGLPDKKITLTLTANGGTYDGSTSFPATTDNASVELDTVTGTTLSAIGYQQKNAAGGWDDIAGAPVDPGEYKAFVTLTHAGGSVTAEKEFTVTKGTADMLGKPSANGITYSQPLASSTFSGGAFTVPGTLSWVYGDILPAVSDSNSTQYDVTFTPTDPNYETLSFKLRLTVSPLKVAEPAATGTYTYTGSEQSVVINGKEDYMTESGVIKATDAGTYTVTYTLDNNHIWDDVSDGTVTWVIDKAEYTDKTAAGEIKMTAGSTAEITLPAIPEGAACGTPGTAFTYVTAPTVDSGKLKLTVGTTNIPAGTGAFTVTIPVTGAKNYLDYEITATVTPTFHTHSFTYTASENTITALCDDSDGQCGLKDKKITLTLTTTSGTYDGTTSFPASTDNAAVGLTSVTGTTLSAIGYQKKNAFGGWDSPVTDAPVNAGTYKAVVTLTHAGGSVTAEQEFTVDKATPVISAVPTADTVTYGQTLADSTLSGGTVSTAGTFAWTAGTTVPAVADSKLTEYDVSFTPADEDNWNSAECKATLPVIPKEITVSGITATDRGYIAGDVSVTLNTDSAVLDGKLAADDLTVTATGTMADDKAGNNKPVAISDLALGGADAANYVLAAGGHQTETTVNIFEDVSAVVIAPRTNSPTYNGTAQELVTAGTAENGVVQYALSTDSTTAPDTGWSTEIPAAADAGTYYVWYKSAGNENYADSEPVCVPVTVARKEITVSSGITATDRGYAAGDVSVTLNTDSAVLDGKLAADELTLTATGTMADDKAGNNKPVAISDLALGGADAANYVLAASGHQTETTVNILEDVSSVITAPQANSLVYNGTAQELVTGGKAENGVVYYAVGTDSTTAPDTGWSTEIPTGTDAGTYYVWYKSVGDENYADSEPVCVPVTISEDLITKITVDQDSVTLKPGETVTVKAVIEPAASTETYAWSSPDESIATVDADGKITAVGPGTVKITVRSASGKAIAEVIITVKADPIQYKLIRGDGQTVLQNAALAVFASNADYSKFVSVEVDGKVVDPGYYSSYSGSTVIELKAAFIRKLSLGIHTIRIISSDGYAAGKFTVRDVPKTGDGSMTLLWTGCLILALAGIVMLSRKKRISRDGSR